MYDVAGATAYATTDNARYVSNQIQIKNILLITHSGRLSYAYHGIEFLAFVLHVR